MPKYFTQTQIDAFQERGYSDPIRFMSPAEMRTFRDLMEAFERDHPEEQGKLVQNPHLLFRWLDGLVRHPVLLDGLEDLVGPDILCTVSAFRRKNPGEGTYAGWHQDAFYLRYDPYFLTCFVAFTDQTVENGCLYVIPGSHRGPILPHEETEDDRSLLTRSQRITAPIDVAKAVPLEIKAGEAFCFSHMTVHSSPANNSKDRRISLLLDILPGNARRKGSRDTATLLRGTDRYGNFEILPTPKDDFGPDARRLHRHACEIRDRESYKGSARRPPALA